MTEPRREHAPRRRSLHRLGDAGLGGVQRVDVLGVTEAVVDAAGDEVAAVSTVLMWRLDAVPGADAGAPRDPGDQAVLLDLAVVVVAVAAVIGRDDEQRLAIEARRRPTASSSVRQAAVGVANGLELRVRHPAVRVAEVVRIGEVNELDLRAASRRSSAPPPRPPSCRSSRGARTRRPSRGGRCARASACRRTRRPLPPFFSAASKIGRHLDVAALRLPRVPVQAVLLDVEPRQHRRVRRQRRRAADGARLSASRRRASGSASCTGGRHAHQRVGAQAVLADDHDVADRGAARSRGGASPAVAAGAGAATGAAAPVGGGGGGRTPCAGSRRPTRQRAGPAANAQRSSPHGRTSVSDGLAAFSNLP